MTEITDGFLQRYTNVGSIAVGALFTLRDDPSNTLWICTGFSRGGDGAVLAIPYLPKIMKFDSTLRITEYTNPAIHDTSDAVPDPFGIGDVIDEFMNDIQTDNIENETLQE